MYKPSGKTLTVIITSICSTAFCLFGYDQGVLSGLIGADNQFGKDFNHPDANTQGLIVSVYQLGNVGGSIVIFLFGDKLGRKNSIFWATIIMLIGAILQTASMNRGMMYAARVITGIGNGANTSTVPVYQAETSTAKARGPLIAVDSCVIIFGILIAYWMDYGFAKVSGPAQWRFPIGFQLVFIVIILILLLFAPETPRFLHAQGKHDEAEEVTARLVGKDVSTSDPRVRELSQDILKALALESEGGPFQFKELLQGGKLQNFRRMCISFASNAFQQLGGIVSLLTLHDPRKHSILTRILSA
jgi:MFS family permease